MCTALTLQSTEGNNFFGRTMDFSYPITPGLFIIPRDFEWNSLATGDKYKNKASFISIGQETNGMLGFFDGVNEHGFAAAVLYFEGYADYDLSTENKVPLASVEFLHYLLGQARSVEDLESLLKNVSIVGVADPVTNRAAPLHWIATDKSGKSVVIEQTKDGLNVFDNEIGVMANSPDFNWHITNLRNYVNLSTTQRKKSNWNNVTLTPFSQGAGTKELPGSFTSPDRFVRTAFLKSHVKTPENQTEAIATGFYVLNSVYIPKGIVETERGTIDYTKYIAFIDLNTASYYFKTYGNDQLLTAKLSDYHTTGTQPIFLGSIEIPYIL